jgi:hypothetical protein
MTDESRQISGWQVFLLIEFAVLLIALLMPVTPSKTGSDWTPAALFFPDPNYWQEVLVYFAFTNIMVGILAVVVMLWWRRQS